MWYLRTLVSSALLCIMLISACGILLKALLAGANTVKECIELRSLTRPAALTLAANEVSSGLCDAAVTTGSMAMPWKLPIPVAGTMPQSGPNLADSVMGCEGEAMAWWGADAPAGADGVPLLPHPAAASARTAAPAPAARTRFLGDRSAASARMASPLPEPGAFPGLTGLLRPIPGIRRRPGASLARLASSQGGR